MTKPIFLSTAQAYALTNTLNGATLDAYLGGTTTPTAFYSDHTLSTSLGSQLTADSEGRFSNAFLPSDIDIKLRLRHTATSTDITFDYAAVDDTPGDLVNFKNKLINGAFNINQRAPATNADDTYCFDRWYVLTQTGTIAVSQVSNPEAGAPTAIRLTQSQASAQRMGLAQIVESANCRDLRSELAALSGRVMMSATGVLRYAILGWAGTADSVTSDVVLDWTSSTYTAGNFFISTVNVLAVGSASCTAGTWRDVTEIVGLLNPTENNLIVFLWTESTVAQNVTLDLSSIQLERGAASEFEHRPLQFEVLLCERYYEKSFPLTTTPAQNAGATGARCFTQAVGASTTQYGFSIVYRQRKRASPTVTLFNPSAANAQMRNLNAGVDWSSTGAGGESDASMFTFNAASAGGTAAGAAAGIHFTAESEL